LIIHPPAPNEDRLSPDWAPEVDVGRIVLVEFNPALRLILGKKLVLAVALLTVTIAVNKSRLNAVPV
jgi:hypothetical protein